MTPPFSERERERERERESESAPPVPQCGARWVVPSVVHCTNIVCLQGILKALISHGCSIFLERLIGYLTSVVHTINLHCILLMQRVTAFDNKKNICIKILNNIKLCNFIKDKYKNSFILH